MNKNASYREHMMLAQEQFVSCGIEDAKADAWYLLEYVTGMRRTDFLLRGRDPMPGEQSVRYQELVRKRAEHIPLQHLTGEQEFMGFPFEVNGDVLIPRQDTEVLVEHALSCLAEVKREGTVRPEVLDLCTGSGCIAVSIAKLGDPVRVTGSDLSEKALAVAQRNSGKLEAEVRWIHSDLFAFFEEAKQDGGFQPFDMIVSNPPYIPTADIEELTEEVRIHEPFTALDGHADGLFFYRKIAAEVSSYLREGGWLLFEIGYDQGPAVSALLQEQGFEEIRVIPDLAGLDRVVRARRRKDV